MIQIHQQTERWPGPDVVIDCPASGERGVVGTVVSAIALFANRKIPVWSKTVSIIALGLSFVPVVLFAGGLVLAMIGVIK